MTTIEVSEEMHQALIALKRPEEDDTLEDTLRRHLDVDIGEINDLDKLPG